MLAFTILSALAFFIQQINFMSDCNFQVSEYVISVCICKISLNYCRKYTQ